MTLLILAAGMGSRYGGLKQIDPIGPSGEFIVDYSIYDAMKAGFDKVVFVIKEDNLELFRDTIGKRIEKHIDVEYVFQKLQDIPEGRTIPEGRVKPWGTGHAVLEAANAVKDNFVVINSDDFYGRDSFLKLGQFLKENTKSNSINHFSMAGFVLENTITENGHVSRGVCETDKDGFLTTVTERTKIQRNGCNIQYFENDAWKDISPKSIVSMNCWAFTPEIFGHLSSLFDSFFENSENADMLKAEFYLPFAVQDMITKGTCNVRVLQTSSKWYGVTYREDRASVVNAIRSMTETGIYPEKLW